MRTKNLLRSLSLADYGFVEEAKPKRHIPKKYFKYAAIAACFCLITALNVWLFAPLNTKPDISRYKGTEYYALINVLNNETYTPSRYRNNFEAIFSQTTDGAIMNNSSDGVFSPQDYQEVTDNQVSGVIEGDLIKRSDKYIYYVDANNFLSIYPIDRENTKCIKKYDLNIFELHSPVSEMYLSEDCSTVILITNNSMGTVSLTSFDVSNPENVTKKSEFRIDGEYLTSRYSNGQILLMTGFEIKEWNLDFSDERTFIPSVTDETGTRSIPMENIDISGANSDLSYSVICTLDAQTLKLNGSKALLSYSDVFYVTEDDIYVCHYPNSICTEITSIRYSDGSLKENGSLTVDGLVYGQWWMDEYNGIFRVVSSFLWGGHAELNCFDTESFTRLATVTDFMPSDEFVNSVRFDKDKAHVCTSTVPNDSPDWIFTISDPVFFFDLSDVYNISYKETEEIEGYSTSLVNFGDGYLLGIGHGETTKDMKLEIYAEGENGVECVNKYVLENTDFSDDYKAYFIDRENKLIGLGVQENGRNEKYLLLHFDGESLNAYGEKISSTGNVDYMRAALIDGYVYFFSTTFDVIPLDEIITN